MQLTSKRRREGGEPVRPTPIVDDSGLRGGGFLAALAALCVWAAIIIALVFAAGGSAQ